MGDLYFAFLLLACVSAAAFAAGRKLARILRKSLLTAFAVGAIAALVGYVVWVCDHPLLTHILPFSNVIVLSYAPLPLAAFLAGVCIEQRALPRWRKSLLGAALLLVALWPLFSMITARLTSSGNRWSDGVCLQTSSAGCAPACAATLLQSAGVTSTEGEMASLCLAGRTGTSRLGIYRGLKLKLRDHPWDINMFSWTRDELRANTDLPLILFVGLERSGSADRKYAERWGWLPGVRHAVVFFGFRGDRVEVGDPAIGREYWSVEDLRVLWHGDGVRLVKRTH